MFLQSWRCVQRLMHRKIRNVCISNVFMCIRANQPMAFNGGHIMKMGGFQAQRVETVSGYHMCFQW